MTQGTTSGRVNLVVALACEARPLIQRFKLRRVRNGTGPTLYGGDSEITLLVSGVGKLATASSCGYLAGLQSRERDSKPAWLNVGIAGHGNRPVGEGFLINKVTDRSSGRSGYPPLLLSTDRPTSNLITVESPEIDYAEDTAYDMEGSAFWSTASRFITSELVQLFKIVSDNPDSPVGQVSEQRITGWIEEQLDCIEQLVAGLAGLSGDYNTVRSLPDEFYRLADLVRLSVSQRIQLESACRRYYALGGTALEKKLKSTPLRNGTELLQYIHSMIPPL